MPCRRPFTLEADTIAAGAAAGVVGYAGLSGITANLSDGDDVVTINGAGADWTMNTGRSLLPESVAGWTAEIYSSLVRR